MIIINKDEFYKFSENFNSNHQSNYIECIKSRLY